MNAILSALSEYEKDKVGQCTSAKEFGKSYKMLT